MPPLFPLLVPAGNDTEVQFNDNGSFGAESAFTFDKTNGNLDIRFDGDSITQGLARNDHAGTSAMARWSGLNGNSGTSIEKLGLNYTSTGRSGRRANMGVVIDTGTSGLNLVASGAAGELGFYTGGDAAANERAYFANDGVFNINNEIVMSGTEPIGIDMSGGTFATAAIKVGAYNIENAKCRMTAIGGYAIKLTNTTGASTVAGQLVDTDPTTDDAVTLAGIGAVDCIGVFLDSGVEDDAEAWVVVAGIADVALDDNVAAVHGNWMATGVAAGYARTSASPAASPNHFEEIGHCIESVSAGGAGTHILARCVLHFN